MSVWKYCSPLDRSGFAPAIYHPTQSQQQAVLTELLASSCASEHAVSEAHLYVFESLSVKCESLVKKLTRWDAETTSIDWALAQGSDQPLAMDLSNSAYGPWTTTASASDVMPRALVTSGEAASLISPPAPLGQSLCARCSVFPRTALPPARSTRHRPSTALLIESHTRLNHALWPPLAAPSAPWDDREDVKLALAFVPVPPEGERTGPERS